MELSDTAASNISDVNVCNTPEERSNGVELMKSTSKSVASQFSQSFTHGCNTAHSSPQEFLSIHNHPINFKYIKALLMQAPSLCGPF